MTWVRKRNYVLSRIECRFDEEAADELLNQIMSDVFVLDSFKKDRQLRVELWLDAGWIIVVPGRCGKRPYSKLRAYAVHCAAIEQELESSIGSAYATKVANLQCQFALDIRSAASTRIEFKGWILFFFLGQVQSPYMMHAV